MEKRGIIFIKNSTKATINTGFILLIQKDIFDYIHFPEDNLETDVFQRLVERYKIGGYRHKGFWNTINTLKDEENLNKLYRNKELKWYDF